MPFPILALPTFTFHSPSPKPAAASIAQTHAKPQLTFIRYGRDLQLYLKTKYDLVHSWDQEFGIQGTLMRCGNFSEATNLCYDPLYPINFHKKPRFSLGFQFNYQFAVQPIKLTVYTKPKTTLGYSLWKEETGISGRLYTSPDLIISANLAWLYNWPYSSRQRPQWLALVNFQFPLGR